MVVFCSTAYYDFIMCETCNLKHIRQSARPVDRLLVNIDPVIDLTVKKSSMSNHLLNRLDVYQMQLYVNSLIL